MAAEDGGQTQAHPKRSPAAPLSGSPTDALTAAFASAEADFRTRTEGDRKVMVAFSLGWQMAEVYRPDRRGGSKPASQDDLPGISRLSAGELEEMGLLQVQAGITKLRDSICDAGLVVPNAERFAQDVKQISGFPARQQAIREFHVGLLATLTAADYRLGKAYGLGRALADTTRLPPDWHAELATHRIPRSQDGSANSPASCLPMPAIRLRSRWRPGAVGRRPRMATAARPGASCLPKAGCGAACSRVRSGQ